MTAPAQASPPLWLAVYGLHWPLRALLGAQPASQVKEAAQPYIVADQQWVCACNAAAQALGVSVGMPSAVAAALVNQPLLKRNHKQEAELQQALCEACYSVTPYVLSANELMGTRGNSLAVQAGVALEVSSCLRLFNGLEGIVQQVRKRLHALNIDAYWAWAHSAEAAWLLSRQQAVPYTLAPAGALAPKAALAALYALPIEAAAPLEDDIERLLAMGFSTLGELCSTASTWRAIKKRLSITSMDYLEALLGCEAQGALFQARPVYYQQELSFSEGIDAEYPISAIEWLQTLIEALLQRLTVFLVKHQCQVQHLRWRLYNIAHEHHTLDIHLERLFSDATLAADITRIHLEQQGLPFEVDRLELHCQSLQPLQIENHTLWAEPSQQNREALARLNAKLQSRMGDTAFYKVSCCDELLPEACVQKIPVQEQASSHLPQGITQKYRPMWLLEPPEKIHRRNGQFYWHGQLEILSEAERIQTQWWLQAAARDYYIARRDDQQLLWLYHDMHRDDWYVHGVFG